jgi:hypothetical protein
MDTYREYAPSDALPRAPSEGRETTEQQDQDDGRSKRLAEIRRDISEYRQQKREIDEVYQYGDRGVPRMRRH